MEEPTGSENDGVKRSEASSEEQEEGGNEPPATKGKKSRKSKSPGKSRKQLPRIAALDPAPRRMGFAERRRQRMIPKAAQQLGTRLHEMHMRRATKVQVFVDPPHPSETLKNVMSLVDALRELFENLPRDSANHIVVSFAWYAVDSVLIRIGARTASSVIGTAPWQRAGRRNDTALKLDTFEDFLGVLVEQVKLTPLPPEQWKTVTTNPQRIQRAKQIAEGGSRAQTPSGATPRLSRQPVDILFTRWVWRMLQGELKNAATQLPSHLLVTLPVLQRFLHIVRSCELKKLIRCVRSVAIDLVDMEPHTRWIHSPAAELPRIDAGLESFPPLRATADCVTSLRSINEMTCSAQAIVVTANGEATRYPPWKVPRRLETTRCATATPFDAEPSAVPYEPRSKTPVILVHRSFPLGPPSTNQKSHTLFSNEAIEASLAAMHDEQLEAQTPTSMTSRVCGSPSPDPTSAMQVDEQRGTRSSMKDGRSLREVLQQRPHSVKTDEAAEKATLRGTVRMSTLLNCDGNELRRDEESVDEWWRRLQSHRFKLSVLRGCDMPHLERELWKKMWVRCFAAIEDAERELRRQLEATRPERLPTQMFHGVTSIDAAVAQMSNDVAGTAVNAALGSLRGASERSLQQMNSVVAKLRTTKAAVHALRLEVRGRQSLRPDTPTGRISPHGAAATGSTHAYGLRHQIAHRQSLQPMVSPFEDVAPGPLKIHVASLRCV